MNFFGMRAKTLTMRSITAMFLKPEAQKNRGPIHSGIGPRWEIHLSSLRQTLVGENYVAGNIIYFKAGRRYPVLAILRTQDQIVQ